MRTRPASAPAWAPSTLLLALGSGGGAAREPCEVPELVQPGASDAAPMGQSDHAMALENDVAVVGAWRDWTVLPRGGEVYADRGDGAAWVQEAELRASDPQGSDFFGVSVALSGNTIVVGPYLDDHGGFSADEDGSGVPDECEAEGH